jgi:hypothetical protein
MVSFPMSIEAYQSSAAGPEQHLLTAFACSWVRNSIVSPT